MLPSASLYGSLRIAQLLFPFRQLKRGFSSQLRVFLCHPLVSFMVFFAIAELPNVILLLNVTVQYALVMPPSDLLWFSYPTMACFTGIDKCGPHVETSNAKSTPTIDSRPFVCFRMHKLMTHCWAKKQLSSKLSNYFWFPKKGGTMFYKRDVIPPWITLYGCNINLNHKFIVVFLCAGKTFFPNNLAIKHILINTYKCIQ